MAYDIDEDLLDSITPEYLEEWRQRQIDNILIEYINQSYFVTGNNKKRKI